MDVKILDIATDKYINKMTDIDKKLKALYNADIRSLSDLEVAYESGFRFNLKKEEIQRFLNEDGIFYINVAELLVSEAEEIDEVDDYFKIEVKDIKLNNVSSCIHTEDSKIYVRSADKEYVRSIPEQISEDIASIISYMKSENTLFLAP